MMATKDRAGVERFPMHRFALDRLYFTAQLNCRCFDSGRPFEKTRRRECLAEKRQSILEMFANGEGDEWLGRPRIGAAIERGRQDWRTNPNARNPYKNRGWGAELNWWWQVGRAWAEWLESDEAVVRALGGIEKDLYKRYWAYREWHQARRSNRG